MARLYFLACFICTLFLVRGQKPEYVLSGTNHTLRLSVPEQPTTILWKHNGNKLIEFDGLEEHVYVPSENKITLDRITAGLEIRDLTFADSGEYVLEVEMKTELLRSLYVLNVMDKVSMPTISCKINEGSSSGDARIQATLLCSAGPRSSHSLLEFKWKSQGNVYTGQKLLITLGDEHDDEEHTCSVKNPVSNETATFTAKECYQDNSSAVAMISGLAFMGLVAILLIMAVLYLRQRQKACFAEGDVENQAGDTRAAQADEGQCLINNSATLPSAQQENGKGIVMERKAEKKCEKDAQPALKKHLENPAEPKNTDSSHEEESESEQEKTAEEDTNETPDQNHPPDHPSSPLPKSGSGSDSDSPAEETNDGSESLSSEQEIENKNTGAATQCIVA